ncbi:PKD domain-containing protein [Nitrosomonas sp.]|uniref:PKD domain-containing protein n=1 Tax=Nitrosomonas sp. TaxID=42353 RepID=UPI0020850FB4|nr:PKD domain-containing protein [Nitrosomonas sp.]GJL76868.1 MAG: hypothetical protein NMNS02_29740 [Nitrosomonas sp.]
MFQKNKNETKIQKLLIIDAGVLDSDLLLKDHHPDYKVIRLKPESDPITQISKALSLHAPVSEISLVAHALPGQIHFSGGLIDFAQLEQHQQQLQAWRKSLSLDAKLCIYACELATGEEGTNFVSLLKDLTGAEVAASSLPIGKVDADNNWGLNHFTKEFGITIPFHPYSTASYAHILAPEISVSGAETVENGFMTFQVKLSEPATSTVRINYRTREELGTALGERIDYDEVNSFVQIAAGQDTAYFNVRTWSDAQDEADESVVVELFNPTNAVFADDVNTLQTVGLILDTDGAGNNLGLFVGNAQIVEGANGVTREVAVPIHLSRPSDQTLIFQYQTADDTAIDGVDYIAQSDFVTFLPGETITAVHIPVIGDDIDEPSETFTLTVTPTSEIANGSAGATGTVTILDGDILPPPEGIIVNAGNNVTLSEGNLFTRTVSFIDDLDTNTDGWNYSVDWGDGSPAETGSIAAGDSSFDISRSFADGDMSYTVSVTVTDTAGDLDTQQFQLDVNNVAPTIALSGESEVNADASYTLNLGAVTDPGDDAVTSYIVNWGDGTIDTFNTAGDVTHTYTASGNKAITVDLVDDDGTHVNAGALSILVNAAPDGVAVDAGNDAAISEGGTFARTITFTDGEDTGVDGWTYSVDFGDGSAVETGSIAAGVNSFDISHVFADGDAFHNVSVTVTDTAGDTDTEQFAMNVFNVIPTITVTGESQVNIGNTYDLNLGAVVDPGDDTVTDFIVNWGDGTTDTFNASGDVTHVYGSPGSNTISVLLEDEDGTHAAIGNFNVQVIDPIAGVSVDAGPNAVINEGEPFVRTITFTGGEDANLDGWTYSTDWGDGSAIELGSIANGANAFGINHVFADGDASHTVTVTVIDTAGDSDTQQFVLDVNNVAPTIALAGAFEVNIGDSYTLNLGAIIDPGDDTVTSYVVDWGDGTNDTFNTAGDVTHTYAAAGDNTITVDLVDEDGTHTNAASLNVTVNPGPPIDGVSVNAGNDTAIDEGGALNRTITFTDGKDTDADGWTYSVDFGDGSAVETGTIAAGINSFDISHVFTDGDDVHNVSVTVTDTGDAADSDTEGFDLNVNNVVPIIAVSGAPEIDAGAAYTFNLGAVTDPGEDTVSEYIVDWGDGTSNTYNTAGDVAHTYAAAGDNTITVDLVDEDGTHTNAASLDVTVIAASAETIRIGDAPLRVSRSNPDIWEEKWTDSMVDISHKADFEDAAEPWSSAALNGRNVNVLNGGDLYGGDLGVSGQSLVSSTIRQEIDGTEALRFDLTDTATGVTIDLSRLEGDATGGFFDAGRLQLLDDSGSMVDELIFSADAAGHEKRITLDLDTGFSSVVLTAGAYNGADFVFGGLSDATGQFQGDPQNLGNGTWNASDYLVDAVEFEFGEVTLVGTAS